MHSVYSIHIKRTIYLPVTLLNRKHILTNIYYVIWSQVICNEQ